MHSSRLVARDKTVRMDREKALARAAAVPVARFATVSVRTGAVDLVPVTFVLAHGRFVTVVDHKPKTTRALARLANVRAGAEVTVLIDHWADDWSRLWWVRLRGSAEVVDDMARPDIVTAVGSLVEKYPPYRAHRPAGPVIVLTVGSVRSWSAS